MPPNPPLRPVADRDGDVVRYRRDESVAPSVAVVEAVAAATDRQPTNLPAIQHTFDVDAFDGLLTAEADDRITVTFAYAGRVVVAEGTGHITVRPNDWRPDDAER